MSTIAEASRQFDAAAQRLPTLFALEDQAYQLLAYLEEAESNDEATDLEAQLALVDQMLMEKTESYVSVIRNLEAMSDARKVEADRLRDRSKTAQQHADWLKARLLMHLQTTGQQRIETSRFTIARKQNPPHVVVLDAAAVPSEFQRTRIDISVDKVAVLAALKRDGVVVPGVELARTESLRIS